MYSQTSNTALIPEATFVPPATTDEPSVLVLIRDLCHELQQSGVRYCHWKSNEAIDK